MIITVGGVSSSGKSTVMKEIALRLGWKRYSLGERIKEMAGSVPLNEFYANMDETTERALDEWQREMGKKMDNFIMDSRLGFKFMPPGKRYNLFFDLPLEEAAERAFRNQNSQFASFGEAYASLEERMTTEQEHYQNLYGPEFIQGKFNHLNKYGLFDDGEPFYHHIVNALSSVETIVEDIYNHVVEEMVRRGEDKFLL